MLNEITRSPCYLEVDSQFPLRMHPKTLASAILPRTLMFAVIAIGFLPCDDNLIGTPLQKLFDIFLLHPSASMNKVYTICISYGTWLCTICIS